MSTNVLEKIEMPELLGCAIKRNRVGHAYLLYGPDQSYLQRTAVNFAAFLFSSAVSYKSDSFECVRSKIERGLHPDVHVLSPEGVGGQIRISSVHEMSRKISLTPAMGDKNVVIIRNAQKMNEESANAILKTLEEPLGKTVFMLLAQNPYQLLDTIRSRCQAVRAPMTSEVLCCLEDAEYRKNRDMIVEKLLVAHRQKDPCGIFDMSDKMSKKIQAMRKKKDDSCQEYIFLIFKITIYWYRDLNMMKLGNHDAVFNKDKIEMLNKFLSCGRSIPSYRVLARMHDKIGMSVFNPNTRLFLENLFLDAIDFESK